MGFDRVQINPFYAQNSREKYDLVVLQALYQVMLNIRRFYWDISLFMTSEFSFIVKMMTVKVQMTVKTSSEYGLDIVSKLT